MKGLKWLVIAILLAGAWGLSYGIYSNWRLKKALHVQDSLLLVNDSLKIWADSLVATSHKRDTVLVQQVINHLVTHWDTVRIDSLVYVPIAQADSVMEQRDQCILAWSECTKARDALELNRSALLALNKNLRETLARDSLKVHGPHLDFSAVAGAGVVYDPKTKSLVVGPGILAGLRVYNLRIF